MCEVEKAQERWKSSDSSPCFPTNFVFKEVQMSTFEFITPLSEQSHAGTAHMVTVVLPTCADTTQFTCSQCTAFLTMK